MDRNNYRCGIKMDKTKVLELAQQCQLIGMRPHLDGIYEQSLQQFAALIEAEVRKKDSRDNVFELMLQAGCPRYCNPENPELEGFIVNDSVLDRIFALVEAEVRGDAEPVGYTNEGYKGMQYASAEMYKQIHPDFIERHKLTAPLFAHPAPAVVAQLVEAAADAKSDIHSARLCEINSMSSRVEMIRLMESACEKLGSALAAAKEAGL